MVPFRKKKNKKNPEEQDYEDLYKRLLADMQNYKRRAAQDRMTSIVHAKTDILTPLLTVIDDVDRAVESCQNFIKFLKIWA
jgi:molecular chaperone GrpE (heat shock protein)